MPRTDWGWHITAEELATWIIRDDDSLLVLNKPAHVVCHPSKKGPWSSLISACREYFGVERLHLISRLDRETSGVIVIAKNAAMARRLQKAMSDRTAVKNYLAILEEDLTESMRVNQPIGRDTSSQFVTRQWIVPNGQPSIT